MMWLTEYLSIPFLSGGRDKNGCDCYGLVRLILMEQYGIILPEFNLYPNALNHNNIENIIERERPLLTGELQENPAPGLVVLFKTKGFKAHLGFMLTNKDVIHTTAGTGVVIDNINSPKVKNKIEGYYSVN